MFSTRNTSISCTHSVWITPAGCGEFTLILLVPSQGICEILVPTAEKFANLKKKMLMPGGLPGVGGHWWN